MKSTNKAKVKKSSLKLSGLQATVLIVIAAFIVVIISNNIGKSNNSEEGNNKNIITLTDANFQSTINSGVTLVDFWAKWCGPCKIQSPIVEKIAEEMGDKVKIAKMDTDKNPNIPESYQITSIPTIMIFKDGNLVETFVGVQQKDLLINAIKKHLN
jgi:thioredoxin 1